MKCLQCNGTGHVLDLTNLFKSYAVIVAHCEACGGTGKCQCEACKGEQPAEELQGYCKKDVLETRADAIALEFITNYTKEPVDGRAFKKLVLEILGLANKALELQHDVIGGHTAEDDFQHFLSYSGYRLRSPGIIPQLREAFMAAWEPCYVNKPLFFSDKIAIEERVKKWCRDYQVTCNPFNTIVALDNMGMLKKE